MSKTKRRGPSVGGKKSQKNLMKQIQQMQVEMEKAQEDLAATEVEGSAGGGAVTVTMDGGKTLKAVHIDPDVIDEDDVEMLEDLIVAAVGDAASKVDELTNDQIGRVTGGVNIPGVM